jgi:two-component system cell cycle sensor histidine kinase/response regulator CckA
MMNRTLRVLNVEDSRVAAEFLQLNLSRAGFAPIFKRVETSEAMKAALETEPWDVILCDFSMPQFNAPEALALVKEMGLDIPFIIISGTVGEAVAVEAMRAGAHDYFMKDNLVRLAPTIEREMAEAENRRARRQAEEWLKNSEERFRALTEKTSDLTAILDVKAMLQYVSPSIERLLGYAAEEWLGKPVFEFIHPGDTQAAMNLLDPGIRHQGTGMPVELRIRHKNGSWRVMEARDTNLLKNKAVAGIVINARDITERKLAEEALRESEERLRTVIENLSEGLVISDLDGQLLHWNHAGIEMHGYQNLDEALLQLPEFEKIFELATLDGTPLSFNEWPLSRIIRGEPVRNLEIRIRRLETDWQRTYSYGGGIVNEPGGKRLAFLTITDITERKKLEEQLRQSQKMEAIGQLAGGVAHDFNNMLTVILGYSQMILCRYPEGDQLSGEIKEIENAARRAASLTSQLLAFSRKQVIQPKILDLSTVIAETEKMLRRLIGENIELVSNLRAGLKPVEVDPGQIEQVIMNLVVNARDAMPDGGKLIIETANVELDETYTREQVGMQPGNYVLLAVSDTGSGMDEEIRSHIFEPFFTTKEVGRGTGLGLSTVFGIIKQSAGHISVYSEPGHGTTFKIYLPGVQELTSAVSVFESAGSLTGGAETILLVEDEQNVRQLAGRILREQGYKVMEAANGEEALEIFQEHSQTKIHLVITDVIMPQMGGKTLAALIKRLRPKTEVLFVSGYTDDAIAHHGVLEPDTAFLQKPFTPEALARKVREVLDGGKK